MEGARRERKGDKTKDEHRAKEEETGEGMRPELLLGISTEDIDHKLIPFKKRQFKQLQFEEIQLKVISISFVSNGILVVIAKINGFGRSRLPC